MDTCIKFIFFLSMAALAGCMAGVEGTDTHKGHGDDWREYQILLSDSTFLDTETVTADDIQNFLTNTRPSWGGPSFLATHMVGDQSFATEIVAIGQRYAVNPVVLMAYMQMHRSMISAREEPSARTLRRALSCECSEEDCGKPGLRHQIVCLARGLSADYQAATKLEPTSSGYTFERSVNRLRPANATTLAMLSHTNLAGADLLYELMLQFKTDLERVSGKDLSRWFAPPARTHFIGSPCDSDSDCRYDGAVCAATSRGRICTMDCSSSSICPDRRGTPITFCLSKDASGFIGDDLPSALCVSRCGSGDSCNVEGFTCAANMARYNQSHVTKNTCLPELTMPPRLDEPDPGLDDPGDPDPIMTEPVPDDYWKLTIVSASVPEFQSASCPPRREPPMCSGTSPWDDWTLVLNWAVYSPDVRVQLKLGCGEAEFCMDEKTAIKTEGHNPTFDEALFENVSRTRLTSLNLQMSISDVDLFGSTTPMGTCNVPIFAADLVGDGGTQTIDCGHGYDRSGSQTPIRVTYRLDRVPAPAAR